MNDSNLSAQQRALKEARTKSRARHPTGKCDCGETGTRRGCEYVCQRCRDLECLHFRRASNASDGQSKYPIWSKYVEPYRIGASWGASFV